MNVYGVGEVAVPRWVKEMLVHHKEIAADGWHGAQADPPEVHILPELLVKVDCREQVLHSEYVGMSLASGKAPEKRRGCCRLGLDGDPDQRREALKKDVLVHSPRQRRTLLRRY